MPSNYDPVNFDGDLESESQFLSSGHQDVSVKLEQEGEVWKIRFLPANLGPRKAFYARIAQHWVNKKPYFCAKHTPVEYGGFLEPGGQPTSQCDLCDVSEDLNTHANKDIANLGYRSMSNPQWLTYCLVISKKKGNQEVIMQGDEMWMPHKFWLNRTLFGELREYFMRYRTKRPELTLSIVDPVHGFDFYVKKSNKKLVLQKDDPRSIFPQGWTEDDNDNLMAYIGEKIRMPTFRPLSDEDMDSARLKIEGEAHKLEATPSRRSVRSADGDNLDNLDDQAPRRQGPPMPSAARSAAPRPPTPPAAPQRSQQPPPRAAAPAPAPARSAAPRPAPVAPPAAQRQVPAGPPQRRTLPPTPPRAPVDDVPMDFEEGGSEAGDQVAPPPPTPSSQLRQAARQHRPVQPPPQQEPVASSVDDDDNVTDEPKDQAPVDANVDDIPQDDPPPAPVEQVQQGPARPVSRMSERLRSAINKVPQ